jgi:MFS family permease
VATASKPEPGTQPARPASEIPRKTTGQLVAHPLAVVALVWTGLFMTTLDASIVNIGLPTIARAFGTPLSGTIEWVIIGYLVVTAALLLTVGRLSDMVGRTSIWMTGLGLFTLASILCGAAPSLQVLIMARLLQGTGAAFLLATGTAMLTDAVPLGQRGRMLGLGAVAIALGTSVGPTLGGLITEHWSWRWIFYVNVPVGLVAVVAARAVFCRAGPDEGKDASTQSGRCCWGSVWRRSPWGCHLAGNGAGPPRACSALWQSGWLRWPARYSRSVMLRIQSSASRCSAIGSSARPSPA